MTKKGKKRSPFGTVAGYDAFLEKQKSDQQQSDLNGNQMVTKRLPNGNQMVTKRLPEKENDDQMVTKRLLESRNGYQMVTKWLPDDIQNIKSIVVTLNVSTKRILGFFVSLCGQQDSNETGPVKYSDIAFSLDITRNNVKQSCFRLKNKNLISQQISKSGRSGYCSFFIPEPVRLVVQKNINLPKIGNQMVTKRLPDDTLVDSIINTTIYAKLENLKAIDPTPLEKEGFSKNHLIQIANEYKQHPEKTLPEDVIQDSIDALAFDLKYNNVAKTFNHPPAVVLTRMLKKGCPYASVTPDKYKTPQQEAMEKYLAMKEAKQKQAKDLENRLKSLAYEEWLSNLGEEKLIQFCAESEIPLGTPETIRRTLRRRKALAFSREYFDAEIWPQKQSELKSQLQDQPDEENAK